MVLFSSDSDLISDVSWNANLSTNSSFCPFTMAFGSVIDFHLIHMLVRLQYLSFQVTKSCPCDIQICFCYTQKFDIFNVFAQNIDCWYTLEVPRRGSSNEYAQSMFWFKNKKNRYTPANPSFSVKKWELWGYTFHGNVFLMFCADC